MTIKRKLTGIMMGTSVVAVVLTATAITAYIIYDARERSLHDLEVTAALTADRNSAALMFLDNERAQKNLEIFRLNPSVLVACVYDVSGELFAAYQADGGASCPGKAVASHPPQAGILVSQKDIRQNGEFVGTVFIAADTREIESYIEKISLISLTLTGLVLGGTLLLTVYFQRAISAPILDLAGTAARIADSRDYSLEAPSHYTDETGTLARAFNAMLAEVRKRDEELQRANETLEMKVASRTQQLEQAREKAEKASEAKSEFLRNMSHEFRTPLHALMSFASYGIKEHGTAPPEQLKRYFEVIQNGAERLAKLVDEVLDLAKLEHGDHAFLFKRTDIADLAAQSAELVQPLLEKKGVTLKLVKPAQDASIVCDHDKVMQVITNLLGNAIKFTPTGKRISLVAQRKPEAGEIEVSVIDEGVGVPEEEKELIFQSFQQSSRTNNGSGGTGLGLAICRYIVDAHGGRIWAENNAQAGAKVTFTLPATLEEGKKIIAGRRG